MKTATVVSFDPVNRTGKLRDDATEAVVHVYGAALRTPAGPQGSPAPLVVGQRVRYEVECGRP